MLSSTIIMSALAIGDSVSWSIKNTVMGGLGEVDIATDTDIMLMDEAFSALDPLIRSDMQKQLIDLQAELKKTIVFITHDLDESLRLGDHIGILNSGKLVQVGTPEEIIMNPADDYVKAFVKDVNRAKVIKAKMV